MSLGGMLSGYVDFPDDLKSYVPDFEYLLYDLSVYTDEEIEGAARTRIGLTLLRDIFTADTEKLLESFFRSVHYLNELEDRQTGIEYFETMIRYLLNGAKQLTKHDMENMIHKVETTFPEGSDMAMTLADILREEGKAEALAETAAQLLFTKFGKVPQDIQERIKNADSAALQRMLSDIFTIEDIEETRKYLQ